MYSHYDRIRAVKRYIRLGKRLKATFRINQRTATLVREGGSGWRVPSAMLHHVMDI